MSTKIQINSLEALERLIGNDNELELELRNSVVQCFVKKHLKDLAKTELLLDISKSVKEEIKNEFFEEIKSGNWNTTTTIFKPEILSEIKEDLRFTARQELQNIVSEVIEEQKVYDKINLKLESTANWISENLSHKTLESRLGKLVDIRLKEKLGIK